MNTRTRMLVAFAVLALVGAGFLWAGDPADLEQLRDTGDCANCDLSAENLEAYDLSGANLANAILTDAQLYKTGFQGANLSGANLTAADLRGADFTTADLSNAVLHLADLTDAVFDQARATGVQTDASTTCPDGSAGPCDLGESE